MLFIIQNLHIIQIALDDAEKATSEPHDICIIKKEDLTKSIDVVPAKYPLKVKLEHLTTLEC